MAEPKNHAGLTWSVADLLRGDYKQSECGPVILPLTVSRRLDCVLEPMKAAVLARYGRPTGRMESDPFAGLIRSILLRSESESCPWFDWPTLSKRLRRRLDEFRRTIRH